jgi:glycosyltransferase involved in cell wall biosynthesis
METTIKMNPLFSVILTTYNRSQFLPRAIHSVLQQSFTHFELIIVDDHSIDNTQEIISEFSDDRIKTIRQPYNQGVSAARNTGIQHAKGEYICFLDDDDEFFTEFLQEIANFINKTKPPFIGLIWVGIAFVYTPNNQANKKTTIKTECWDLTKEKNLLYLMQIGFNGITFHRHCFERIGLFNTKLHYAEDQDLIFRCLEDNIKYTSIPKALRKIHIHAQHSLSRSINCAEKIAYMEYFLANHDKFLQKNLSLWLYYYTKLVGDYYHTGKKQQARKLVQNICSKKPFSPKIWELFLRFELLKPLKSVLTKVFIN